MESATAELQTRPIIGGRRPEAEGWDEVRSPYDGRVVSRVARAGRDRVAEAVSVATAAFEEGGFPQHDRAQALERSAAIVEERSEELARILVAEAGKPIRDARRETERCCSTLRSSADAARAIRAEGVPLEGSSAGAGKLGLVVRVPYGVVGAISPFNFPLNLVAHKLGPALAAGNAVVLKPAEQAPTPGVRLAEIMLEAGVPEGWLSVVTGLGSETGAALVEDPRVRAITFTGSTSVGWEIRARAPRKKVNLELGSNAPLIVCEDGDWERAADVAARQAFAYAGQACISVQRMLVHSKHHDRFRDRVVSQAQALQVGDPASEATDVGPVISPDQRDRVARWIEKALAGGAELLCGGGLTDQDRCLEPTVLGSPSPDLEVWREEVFAPLATLTPFDELGEAIVAANDTRFGLQAGVFTASIGSALRAARELEYGGVIVNDGPTFRSDVMPYGGVKDSGNTREGPEAAIAELTEQRLVSLEA